MHVERAIERYGPLVMSLIWRINGNRDETADLYQEVFVKFHETTSERGPLEQPKAWLCRTAINAALDFNRPASAVCLLERIGGGTSQLGGEQCTRKWSYGRKDPPSHGGFARAPQRSLRPPVLPRLFPSSRSPRLLNCSAGAARAAAFQAAKQIRAWLTCDCPSATTSNPKEINR